MLVVNNNKVAEVGTYQSDRFSAFSRMPDVVTSIPAPLEHMRPNPFPPRVLEVCVRYLRSPTMSASLLCDLMSFSSRITNMPQQTEWESQR